MPDFVTDSKIEMLERNGLIHTRIIDRSQRWLALTGKAYDAVENDFEKQKKSSPGEQTIINLHGDLHGDNARINLQSTDKSTNVVDKTADELFAELIATIESELGDSPDKEELIETAETMKQAETKSGYLKAYSRFVDLAANHVGILQPFIGALWQASQTPLA